jgi:hypothetical protein
MNASVNLKDFIIAFVMAIALLIPYELYMKHVEHWPLGYDLTSLDTWADWRGKVDDLSSNDVLILGSSRGHFDININLWDSITGTKPIMLAFPGSSPFHTVEDIVEKSNFNGLLILSVAPGLFYTMRGSWGANEGKKLVDHYYNRTYAQKFTSRVYNFIDPLLSYTQGSDLSFKSLLERINLPNRDSVNAPKIWPPMVSMDEYRSIRMIPEMETDTVLQRRQKDIWFHPNSENEFADSVSAVLSHYTNLVKKIKERGGRVAFVRPPITGYYLEMEGRLFPRKEYWDRLIEECDCVGYHYDDYEETKNMIPPEWSHLNRRDSDIYTKKLVELLRADNLLK